MSGSAGTGLKSLPCHALSVEVARVTTRSLKPNDRAETTAAVNSSGARIWCAESPAAFIEVTSLFWLSVARVMMVASSTE